MKVLLLTSKLNFKTAGGSVMDFHLKAKGLVDEGHQVTVVTAFSKANIVTDPLPYTLIEEFTTARGLLGIQKHGLNILKKYGDDADVIYIDGQIFIYSGGLYRKHGGKAPVVAFFNIRLNCMGDTSGNAHADNSLRKRQKRKLRLALEGSIGVHIANHVDWFIFNTPHVREIYRKFGYDTSRSTIIEDFVDMQRTIDANHITEQLITARQKDKKTITLFSTGRMLEEKGFDIIVNAFTLLKDKDRYRVIISGDGPDKGRIEGLLKEAKLEQYFTLPGWVTKEQLTEYFLTSQIFIFPKWWIDYGSALLTEALAFGLPSIIPGGGALEWLTEGKMLMFRNNDPKEMAVAIERLANDETLRILVSKDSLVRAKTLDAKILSRKLGELLLQESSKTKKGD